MKKQYVKSLFGIVVALFFCLYEVFNVFATNNDCISWYCIREKNHAQPGLDSTLSVIDGYKCLYLDKLHSSQSEERVVYLTFDVGYENGNVGRILDIMKNNDVRGAFFILGNVINKEPQLVERMIDDGHTVCNHTFSHKNMTKCANLTEFKEEIERLETAYAELTGKSISKYYRPPEGRFNEQNLKHAQELGYTTVFWSFAYADWDNDNQPSPEKAYKIIMDNIHNGAILLLHPTSSTNAEILDCVIRDLKKGGYRFGSLDEIQIG